MEAGLYLIRNLLLPESKMVGHERLELSTPSLRVTCSTN